MSFSQIAKNELCRIQLENRCCEIAELSGIMKMSGSINIGNKLGMGFKISTENPAIARRAFTLIKNIYGKHTEIMVKKNSSLKKNNVYILSITPDVGAKDILVNEGILKESKEGALGFISRISPSIIKNDCCKMAYLRGAFLGGGSISNPEKTYHMEFVSSSLEQAEDLMKLINSFSSNAKLIQRKNSFVVYLKEGNHIIDVLSIIGAHTALLEFENVRIYKEVRNNVNRLVNCETANLNKTVDAAIRQIESIKFIKEKCGFRKLSPSLKEVAEIRLNYPDISLKEIGQMLNPPIGKSGVNHRLRKIEKIAEELRD